MVEFRLAATRAPGTRAPDLDDAQRRVVEHADGPLLVLAGPGTGKTTTMVESIVDLVERRAVPPEQILALTFSRKAAEQLRDRVTARLGRALGTSLAATFHSFAYSLVRHHADAEAYAAPLRLLSAPQQDVVLQELLRPHAEAVRWPDELAEAVRTRGFSREVQTVLARARERGLDGDLLADLGRRSGRPEWVAAGDFLEQYLTNLDHQSALDYSDLLVRAVGLADRPAVQADLRRRWTHVFVDEYQDTDPAQVALLQALAGDGRHLVVVGDPDQSIYGFRGAEVRGILDFPDDFRTRGGAPAPVVALTTTRRFGPTLLEASRRVVSSLPTRGAIPREALEVFRDPRPAQGTPTGGVEVAWFDTPRAEVEHLADLLRRAHLEDGVPWSEMAVLVRNGSAAIPVLRRSLSAAGVPVEVAADDTPMTAEPAVRTLLDALRVALHLDTDDPHHPHHVDPDKAESLLLSPLGSMDAAEVRLLGRKLHRREKTRAAIDDRRVRSSRELVREAVLDPTVLEGLEPGREVDKAVRLAGLLRQAHERLAAHDTAEQVLWLLWSSTRWPERLRAAAMAGGSGAASAHRELDALCALFDEAAKTEEQRDHTSVAVFLDTLLAQQIPGDTLAERGVRGEAVRLLTAHRSKGLEWRLVVVAQVQEGVWPDLRRRSSLLGADEIGPDGPLPPLPTQALLAEERRLFYVACTRATERLVVTAVASTDDDGDQPSRFTTELVAPDDVRRVQGRPRRPLSLDGLVADLRRTAADPDTSPGLRAAAVRRLAGLALERQGEQGAGRQLVPAADPATWWGTRSRSQASAPLRPVDEPLTLSASALDALLTCPARWFLEREAGGSDPSSAAQGFGNVVHTLVDRIAKGDLDPDTTEDDLMEHVDRVWTQLRFRTPWAGPREREEVRAALGRFLRWHRRPDSRRVLGTEIEIRAEVVVEGQQVRLHGFADRLEQDAEGRVVVVDFKTTKQAPREADLPEHPQLGLYQLAVAHGAVDHLLDGQAARPGGAELVQLRKEVRGEAKVQRQDPQDPDDDGRLPVEVQLGEAVRRLRGESFPARAGDHCDHCGFAALCPTKGSGTVLS